MTLRTKLAALCAILLASSPALAQDGPIGIAFAEAPEQSSGVCTGQSTDKTLACARAKCVEGGGLPAGEMVLSGRLVG